MTINVEVRTELSDRLANLRRYFSENFQFDREFSLALTKLDEFELWAIRCSENNDEIEIEDDGTAGVLVS